MSGNNYLKKLLNDNYRENIEHVLKTMYEGNKKSFFDCCGRIIGVLDSVVKKGYLSYEKYKIMKDSLMNSCIDQESTIISQESEKITVLNTDTGTVDSFFLADFVYWFVKMFTTDPLFRKGLNGHYDYTGVMSLLDEISDLPGDVRTSLSGIENVVGCISYLYIAYEEDEKIKLIKVRKAAGMGSEMKEIMLLENAEMFADSQKKCFYVNHADGMGRKVDFYNGKETIIPGKVINLSDQGEIIVMTEDNLCVVKENGAIVKIGSVKNTIFNANETNGVSWLNDNGGKLQLCWYSNNGKIQTSHSLKSECVWSYILKNGYRYHDKSDNRMSYILWLYKSCQLPVPFTLKNIQTAIAAFETGIARGYIEKALEYVAIIGFLITLDREDEDMTDALFEHFNIQINDIGYVKKNGVNIYRDLWLKKISG